MNARKSIRNLAIDIGLCYQCGSYDDPEDFLEDALFTFQTLEAIVLVASDKAKAFVKPYGCIPNVFDPQIGGPYGHGYVFAPLNDDIADGVSKGDTQLGQFLGDARNSLDRYASRAPEWKLPKVEIKIKSRSRPVGSVEEIKALDYKFPLAEGEGLRGV